ncbi:hypothetical protein JW711_06320, partial [Candidatus Woesearchaeota archaeon]|nr:hypothetical protein [Candidatus Woesearchaeota archaeon]
AGEGADYDPVWGCCGDGKLRESGELNCQATALCDGDHWHDSNDESQLGEVFYLPEDANFPYPIVNTGVGRPLIACVDEHQITEVLKNRVGCSNPDAAGCVPDVVGAVDPSELCPNNPDSVLPTSQQPPPEGGAQGPDFSLDYLCPAGTYHAISNPVPGTGGPCRSPGTHKRKNALEYGEGYFFCTRGYYEPSEIPVEDSWGHAYLLDAPYADKNLPFDEQNPPIAASATTARCPSSLSFPWLLPDQTVSKVTIIPCPGIVPVSVESNNFYVGPFGSLMERIAGACFPKKSGKPMFGFAEMFRNLDFIAARPKTSNDILGTVVNHSYLCAVDETVAPAIKGESNAYVAICCGEKGCGDIPGDLDPRGAKIVGTGTAITSHYGDTWEDGSQHYGSYERMYCNSRGEWVFSLDDDEVGCRKAGFFWTGGERGLCCGEEDGFLHGDKQAEEYYSDPGPRSIGVCFDTEFQQNNHFLNPYNPASMSVWIGEGDYYGCKGDMWRYNKKGYEFPDENILLAGENADYLDLHMMNMNLFISAPNNQYLGVDKDMGNLDILSRLGLDVAFSNKSDVLLTSWLGNYAGNGMEVFVTLLKGDGSYLIRSKKVATPASKPSTLKVAYNPDKDVFLVVWNENASGVFGVVVRPDGYVEKPRFLIISGSCQLGDGRTSLGEIDYNQDAKRYVLSCMRANNYLFERPIVATTLSMDAVPSGSLVDFGSGLAPSVAAGPTNYLVTWKSGGVLKARLVNYDGSFASPVKNIPATYSPSWFVSTEQYYSSINDAVAYYNSVNKSYDLFYLSSNQTMKKIRILVSGTFSDPVGYSSMKHGKILGSVFIPSKNKYYFAVPSSNSDHVTDKDLEAPHYTSYPFERGLAVAEYDENATFLSAYDVANLNPTLEHGVRRAGMLFGDFRANFAALADANGVPFSTFLEQVFHFNLESAGYIGPFGQFGGLAPIEATAMTWWQKGEMLFEYANGTTYPTYGMGFTNLTKATIYDLVNYYPECTTTYLPKRGNYFCDVDGNWKYARGSLVSPHLSKLPYDLFIYMQSQNYSVQLSPQACCGEDSCWDPLEGRCIGEQKEYDEFYFVNETGNSYKCQGGEWALQGAKRFTPDGCFGGFCPVDGQCLFNPLGSPKDNGMIGYGYRPQCLDSGQFLNDDYCANGSWSSRTRLAAIALSRLVNSPTEEFVLSCSDPEDLYIQEQNPGMINSVCVLDLKPNQPEPYNQRIFATSLNQDFELPENETNLGRDYWYAMKQSFWLAYPGADLNSTCMTASGFMIPCAKGGDSGSASSKLLNLYLDNSTGIIVFSDRQISGLKPTLQQQLCTYFPSWLQWLCPPLPDPGISLKNLTFQYLHAARMGNAESIGTSYERCECVDCPKNLVYSFYYKGFSSSDILSKFSVAGSHIAEEFNITILPPNSARIDVVNPAYREKRNLWKLLAFLKADGR